MNITNGAGPPGSQLVKKLEAIEDRGGGKDIKPVKTTLNRVPRQSDALFTVPLPTDLKTYILYRCLREFSHRQLSLLSL